MQKASQGIGLTELIEEIDTKLTYGGARKVSEFEAELLDQIDESYDVQIKMQRELDYEKRNTIRAQENLKRTEDAISEYCSKTTRDKILLARGWQFRPEEVEEIRKALSDREILEQINRDNGNTDKIQIQSVVKNAIAGGITLQDVSSADHAEQVGKLEVETGLDGEKR